MTVTTVFILVIVALLAVIGYRCLPALPKSLRRSKREPFPH